MADILADNRRTLHEYETLEQYEAGIALFGFEAKAVHQHKMALAGSYIFPRKGELWLVGATIAPYQPNNTPTTYQPARDRKLLLHKKEINALVGAFTTKGLTILPIKVYTKGRKIKVVLGIARKIKKHDKRQRIRERETKRNVARTLKEF